MTHHCATCAAITPATPDAVIARALTVEASKLYFRLRLAAIVDETRDVDR